jgi:DNA polymerase, archaea type
LANSDYDLNTEAIEVKESKKGVFFNVEQCYLKGAPTGLRFLGRWSDKTKMDFVVQGQMPYFYILESEEDLIAFPCVKQYGLTSIYGDKLIKLTIDNPFDMWTYKGMFTKTFEADIHYTMKYLIDNDLFDGIEIKDGKILPNEVEVQPRVMIFDIETDYKGGSNSEMLEPIISIAMFDSYTNKLYCVATKSDGETFVKKFQSTQKELKTDLEVELQVVSTEQELMQIFKQKVIDMDIDIFTGWNVNFDIIYILHRLTLLKMQPEELSPLRKIAYSTEHVVSGGKQQKYSTGKHEKKVTIRGRAIVDLMAGYKRMKWKSVPSGRLEAVGQAEFKTGKIQYKGWIHDFWIADFDKFIEYNIRDVEICIALNKKYNVLNSLMGIKKMSGCELADILQNSRIIDTYILRNCKNKIILPSKNYAKDYDAIEGGFVLPPRSGISRNIVVLDLKSLYPSIMLSFNMSPETIDLNGEIDVGNGIRFKKQTGILKHILQDILQKRDDVRALLKTPEYDKEKYPDKYLTMYKKQYYYKTFQNSFYGATLYPGFRLFNPDIGKSITFVGRFLNECMRKLATDQGYEVITADTDSIYVDVHESDREKAKIIGEKLEDQINRSFATWFTGKNNDASFISIKFEKLYGIYANAGGKKCYAGQIVWDWEKGWLDVPDVEIKGFATVKSDRSAFSKKMQRKVIEMILNEIDTKEILEFIKSEINSVYSMKYGFEEFGIPKAISKNIEEYRISNPWITGVKWSLENVNGFVFSPKPFLLYTKKTSQYNTDCFCFNNSWEVPKDIKIDWERMLMNSVFKIVEKLLEMMHVDSKLIESYIKNKINNQRFLDSF